MVVSLFADSALGGAKGVFADIEAPRKVKQYQYLSTGSQKRY
jgi:hypothetical protein